MFIVTGYRRFVRNKGFSKNFNECGACKETGRFRVIGEITFFTFFWIPIFPYSYKYYIVCPMCNARYKVKKAQAMELIMEQEQ